MKATDIVTAVSTAIIPPGAPLPFVEIKGARFEGPNKITADVVMFDGRPARMRLTKWAFGWSHGWDSIPGGDISLEAGGWERVEPEWEQASLPFEPDMALADSTS